MSEFVERTVARAALPIALTTCAVLSVTILVVYYLGAKFGNDFGVYWRTANQSAELAYFWPGRFPFPYAPTMLLWIQPLSAIPKWPAYFLFGALSTAALVFALRPYLPKAAIALTLISPSFVRGVLTGQVCAAMTALTIWACGTGNRIAAGIAFGVIASIKPQLVIMAPLMLALNRDWRAFGAAGVTFLATVILSVVIFGPDRWSEWLGSMDHFRSAVAGSNIITSGVTPATVAERFGLPPLPFMLLGTVAGAVVTYLCRNTDPIEKAAAITLGSLFAAPYALAYDLLGVVPFLALMIVRGRILCAVALAAAMHPVPIIVSAFELLRRQQFSAALASRESRCRHRVTSV